MAPSPWTADRLAELERLRGQGLSASQAASHLGVSRSAILGIAHRELGGWGRSPAGKKIIREKARASRWGASKAAKAMQRRPQPRTRAVAPEAGAQLAAPNYVQPSEGRVAIEDLGARSCRWPLGDPRDPGLRFCGCRTVSAGDPYCREHAALAMPKPMRGAA